MERSVLIRGVGLDNRGCQRREITMCKYSNETVEETIAMLVPALVDREVVRVMLDIALPPAIEGEEPPTLEQ